jgi:hypothetical protein
VRRLRVAVLWVLSSGAVFALVVLTRMASDSLLARWKMGGGDWLQPASQALFAPTAMVFLPVPMVTDKRLGALVAALCLGVWGALLLLAVRALVRRRRAAA